MEDEKEYIVLIVGDNTEISNSSYEELDVSQSDETAEFSQTSVTELNDQEPMKNTVKDREFIEVKVESTESLFDLDDLNQEQSDETTNLEYLNEESCVPDSTEFFKTEREVDYIFKTEIEVEHNLDNEQESKKNRRLKKKYKSSIYNKINKSKKIGHKFMKPLSEHKSFVNELRCQFPELEQDEELLISTLANIMKDIKTPILPADCFLIDGVQFKCSACGSLSNTKWKAKLHYQYVHGPRYLICFACGTDFRCIVSLYEHEKRCCNEDAVIVLKARAQIIGEKARNRPFLDIKKRREEISIEKEKKIVENRPRHVCSECNVEFSSKLSLERHTRLHRGLRPFLCGVCAAAYSSSQGLRRHMKKHSTEEYICDICQRSFKIKYCLISHLSTHFPQNKYECMYCGKRYSKKIDLTAHVDTIHLNQPRPHTCPVCNKGFLRLSTLQYHTKHKHGMTIITRQALLRQLPKLSDEKNQQLVKSAVMIKHVDGNRQIVVPR